MKDKLKALLGAAWAKISAATFIALTLGGLVYVILEYRNILMDLLIKGARRDMDNAKKQDGVLKQQEDDAKKKADDLIAKANKESAEDDWNKK